jgi:hypothetical protein
VAKKTHNRLKQYLKTIRKATRQAEIDAGMVGHFKSKTLPDKRKEEDRKKCRTQPNLKDLE